MKIENRLAKILVHYRLFSTKKNKKKLENNLIRVLICGQIKPLWVAGSVPALVVSLLFSAFLVLAAFPGGARAETPVPDTGQTKCYNADGAEISAPVPGAAFYGQDAQYNPAARQHSYTKLDASGNTLSASATTACRQVRDNVTGLIWEVKTDDGSVHDKDNAYNWSSAQSTFIAALNAENSGSGYCGHSDWRLPTIKELSGLVDSGRNGRPYINTTYFPQTWSSYYWSSTTHAYYTYGAWLVSFDDGGVGGSYKSTGYYVRAVRSGQSGSLGHSAISVSPTSLDFGPVPYASASVARNLTISNSGAAALDISNIAISGAGAAHFSLAPNPCNGASIAPGANCEMTITFSPTSVGEKEAVLTIESNDPDEPSLEVPLAGAGIIATYGTTVITHGFLLGTKVATWVEAMAYAVVERAGKGRIWRYYKDLGKFKPDPEGDSSGEQVLIFDWASTSDNWGHGFSEAAADSMFVALLYAKRLQHLSLDHLHFIGHSRGTVVTSEVVERLLASEEVDSVEHVTTLDPVWDGSNLFHLANDHDVNKYINFSANNLEPGQGTIVWKGIERADNYFSTDDCKHDWFKLNGNLLNGVINDSASQNLTGRGCCDYCDDPDSCHGEIDHSGVHAWYYGTIALNAENDQANISISDNYWYGMSFGICGSNGEQGISYKDRGKDGYYYSRIAGYVGDAMIFNGIPVEFDYGLEGIVNGSLDYGDSDDLPGWSLAGGSFDVGTIQSNKICLSALHQTATHSYFYIPRNASKIRFVFSVIQTDPINAGQFNIDLIDMETNQVYHRYPERFNSDWSNHRGEVSLAGLEGKLMSMEVSYTPYNDGDETHIYLDDFHFELAGQGGHDTFQYLDVSEGESVENYGFSDGSGIYCSGTAFGREYAGSMGLQIGPVRSTSGAVRSSSQESGTAVRTGGANSLTISFPVPAIIVQLQLADFDGNTTVTAYDKFGTVLKTLTIEGDAPITYTIAGVGEISEVVISSDSCWLGSVGYTLVETAEIDDAIAYYTFENSADDLTSNSFDGVLHGGATVTSGRLVIGDDSTSYMTLPDQTLSGAEDFSIFFNFKLDVTADHNLNTFLSTYASNNREGFTVAYQQNSGEHFIQVFRSYFSRQFPIDALVVGQEYTLALCRAGADLTLYLDGQKLGTEDWGDYALTIYADSIIVGQEQDVHGGGFQRSQSLAGSMDNLRIYDRALSQAEVETLSEAEVDLDTGLVAYYPLDGNTNDASGSNNDGSSHGLTYVEGVTGQAAVFNGSSAYIEIPQSDNFVFSSGAAVSFWMYLVRDGSEQNAIYFRDEGQTNDPLIVVKIDDGGGSSDRLSFRGTSDYVRVLEHDFLPEDRWVHVVMSLSRADDEDKIEVYLDGQKTDYDTSNNIGDLDFSDLGSGSSGINIGRSPAGSGYFEGMLDDVRIYNRSLTQSQVDELFAGVVVTHPDIYINHTVLDFEAVGLTSPGTSLNLTISNNGDAELSISSIVITGEGASCFSVTGDACPETLQPGDSCSLTLLFSPLSEGAQEAVLTIINSDPDEPEVTVALSGTGVCLDWYYQDSDGDGYGDSETSVQSCSKPDGYVADNSDCDDNDANEHPGQVWYKDQDGDKYSDGTTNSSSCSRPAGYFIAAELTATTGDHDDNDNTIYPGASEICDGKDNDQDGETDEDCGSDTVFISDGGGCGGNYPCHETIQGAYSALSAGETIKIKSGFYLEDLIFSDDKEITLSGGWNSDYSSNSTGFFATIGSLTITGGCVVVEGIILDGTASDSLAKNMELKFSSWRSKFSNRCD